MTTGRRGLIYLPPPQVPAERGGTLRLQLCKRGRLTPPPGKAARPQAGDKPTPPHPARSPFGPANDRRRAQLPARSTYMREIPLPPPFPCHSLTGQKGQTEPHRHFPPHGPGPGSGSGPGPAAPRRPSLKPHRALRAPTAALAVSRARKAKDSTRNRRPLTGNRRHLPPHSPFNASHRRRPPAPSLARHSGKRSSRAAAGSARGRLGGLQLPGCLAPRTARRRRVRKRSGGGRARC